MSFAATPHSLSAMPLACLSAIVLDTETTGLDAAKDRVIEIGAVRLAGQDGDRAETYAALVNPAIPIPPASTEVHGITDNDVAAAPRFAEVMAEFAVWAGPAVIVGYSIGFDMAMLKAEHDRNGVIWSAPRSLDVRHLTQLLAPNLPNQSLETTAAWLDIEVSDRHRALGDALLTAKIFNALVPRLHAQGIATLAQAERACRSLAGRREDENRAGWHEAPGVSVAAERLSEYARVDSFPYRHTVADIMNTQPLIVPDDMKLRDAIALMTERKVSSLFFAPPAAWERPLAKESGIVTERDVLRALARSGSAALEGDVAASGHRPLVTVGGEEFVYRAMTRMTLEGFRHLGVSDEAGRIVGALSARDLLRQRADDAVSLADSIEHAQTPAELGRVWSELTTVARALVYEEIDARDIAAIVSRELRALTRRACELAEREMLAAGKGPPPVPYAMLVLGSGGRGESLLAMDQDNAIVFEEGREGEAADLWFEALGKRVADTLNQVGVAYCKGGVMASNATWRKDLACWRETVRSWITRNRPEDLLNCDIFFDAVWVHGDRALAEALHEEAVEMARGARTFLRFLALNASSFEVPVGWFGRLQLDRGRVDIKKGGIMTIFSAARVAALEHGLMQRATPQRLEALRALGVVSPGTIDNLIEAHKVLLDLILRQQLRDIDHGLPLSNKVAPAEMSAFEKDQLKWALEQVPSVNVLLGTPVLA